MADDDELHTTPWSLPLDSLDTELATAMEITYTLIAMHPSNRDTEDQLRMRIVAYNLKALAKVLLIADDHPEQLRVNIKQIVLGLLGTADWLTKTLPIVDESMTVPDE